MNLNSLKTPTGGELRWTTNQDGLYIAKVFGEQYVAAAVPLEYLEKLTIHQIGVIAERCILRLKDDLQAEIERSSLSSSNSTPT